jgi:lipopolysaccharide/colanic/teichoic acid biosynthesis glycosyltransferase
MPIGVSAPKEVGLERTGIRRQHRFGAGQQVVPGEQRFRLPLWAAVFAGKRINHRLCLFLKRDIDVVGAAALLVLSAPLLLCVAVMVKLSSRGPVLFKQVRVGLKGHRFSMLKFRTMVENAEAMKPQLIGHNESGRVLFKIRNDPRITYVGRILRRTSLDELPQFWNVLRGEMSLVGPRPPLPDEVAQYTAMMRRRLSVKPGITGFWQVSGRAAVPHLRGFALDVWYARNWCLSFDIAILIRTIFAVVSRRGAY